MDQQLIRNFSIVAHIDHGIAVALALPAAHVFEGMRAAGKVVAEMHEVVRAAARPGVTTASLDRIARDVIERQLRQLTLLARSFRRGELRQHQLRDQERRRRGHHTARDQMPTDPRHLVAQVEQPAPGGLRKSGPR